MLGGTEKRSRRGPSSGNLRGEAHALPFRTAPPHSKLRRAPTSTSTSSTARILSCSCPPHHFRLTFTSLLAARKDRLTRWRTYRTPRQDARPTIRRGRRKWQKGRMAPVASLRPGSTWVTCLAMVCTLSPGPWKDRQDGAVARFCARTAVHRFSGASASLLGLAIMLHFFLVLHANCAPHCFRDLGGSGAG